MASLLRRFVTEYLSPALIYLLWFGIPVFLLIWSLLFDPDRSRVIPKHFGIGVLTPLGFGMFSIGLGVFLVRADFDGNLSAAIDRVRHFFVDQGRAAMLIGGGLASIMLAAFLYFPPQEGPAERFAAIGGIYSGLLTIFIAAQLFYDRVGPITSVEGLLRSLTADLKFECKDGTRLIFVYQQPNIGHYRSLTHRSYAYDLFKEELERAISKAGVGARFVAIENEEADGFWSAYLDGTNPDGFPDRHGRGKEWYVGQMVEHCNEVFQKLQKRGKCERIRAEKFPPQAIVIGDVCYQITTYGLPMAVGDQFYTTTGEPHLAQIVAYRRTDPDLATSIINETDRWLLLPKDAAATKAGAASAPVNVGSAYSITCSEVAVEPALGEQ
jgi:hypothetical protein